MPQNRHTASAALDAYDAGSGASTNDDAGNNAGISNGGTVGECTSSVVTG